MIKKFKLFEQLEEEESWWEEESPFDEIVPENIIKATLIRYPSIDYVDVGLVTSLLNLTNSEKDKIEARKITNSLNREGLNKYNMLYDDIDYKKLDVGSVVMSNIPNIDKISREYKIVRIDKRYWSAYINHRDGIYSILPYNIKEVIKY